MIDLIAGFDGYTSDPLGGQLCLSIGDYQQTTKMVSHHQHSLEHSLVSVKHSLTCLC